MLKEIPGPLNGRKQERRSNLPVNGVRNANVLIQMPTPALRPFVKRFAMVEFPIDRKLKFLPTTNFLAEFRITGDAVDGGTQLPRLSISGLRDTASKQRSYSGGSAILLTLFTENGALAFLRNPLDAFLNTTIPMELVCPAPEWGLLNEQLAAAKDHPQRIQVAESFLLQHVQNNKPDPIVSAAVSSIEETSATISIEELALQTGLSQSALERRFRRKVGTSPKRFASILRLKNAIGLRVRGHDFTSIAYSAGYSDQSHFINDFKRSTGFAPSAFFQRSAICKNAEFLQVAFESTS